MYRESKIIRKPFILGTHVLHSIRAQGAGAGRIQSRLGFEFANFSDQSNECAQARCSFARGDRYPSWSARAVLARPSTVAHLLGRIVPRCENVKGDTGSAHRIVLKQFLKGSLLRVGLVQQTARTEAPRSCLVKARPPDTAASLFQPGRSARIP